MDGPKVMSLWKISSESSCKESYTPLPLSLFHVGKDKVNANKQEEQRAKAEEELEKLHQLITQRAQ